MLTGNPEQLFEDSRQLTREQVFERYMVPADSFDGTLLPDEIWEKRGHGEEALIRPTASFIMPQIRKTYDAGHFENLGRHICTSEDGQLQNGAVALIGVEHINQYLADLNSFFETEIPLEDIPFHEEFGGYLVTIFGHNRQIGIASHNLSQSGHPDIGVPFDVKVYRDPTFWRVLGMQAAENTGLSPDLWERSRAIVHYEQLRSRDGVPATNEETAKVFGIDEAQIIKARRYESLPAPIKELVETKSMVYSAALEFTPLFGYYDENTICDLATRFANEGRSSKQVEKEVKLRIAAIQVSPEVAVYAEEGHLSYSQANHLLKLRNINEPVESLNHFAKIIIRDGLNDAQTAKLVKSVIAERRKNTHGFWHDSGMTQDQVHAAAIELGLDDGTAHRTGSELRDILVKIRTLQGQAKLGIVDAADLSRIRVADLVEGEIGDILAAIEKGEASGLSSEALDGLTELMDTYDQIEAGQLQDELKEKVVEFRQRLQSKLGSTAVQESMFA